jgi:hypothetical protein
MSTYVPPTDFCPNEESFTYHTGVTCRFVGPALLMITMDEGKPSFTTTELTRIVNYLISEGILTEEHKTWLTKNNKKIQFFVVTHDHIKMEPDWRTNQYIPIW